MAEPENGNSDLERLGLVKGSPLLRLLGGDGPIPHRVVDDFAGAGGRFKGHPIAIRSLSMETIERAQAEAIKHLVDVCGYQREDLYTELADGYLQSETKVQILSRAMVNPDNPREPFARDAGELRRLLEPDEVGALFELFADYQESRSPLSKLRTQEEVDSFLDDLGKGRVASTALLRFDSTSLRSMLRTSVERLRRLTRPVSADSSSTSGPGGPSSTD